MTKIIVGMDGSPGAAAALRWAVREAELRDADVTAVAVWSYMDQAHAGPGGKFDPEYSDAQARKALDHILDASVGAEVAGRITREVICDLPAAGLLQAAEDADLLVVGARGLGGFKSLLLGSVSEQCLHHATCPVAVIRTPDSRPVKPADASEDRPEKVVVGLDGSAPSRRALTWALDAARARQASVTVVHAWRSPIVGVGGTVFALDSEAIQDAAARVLDEAVDACDTDGLAAPIERMVAGGPPAQVLLEAAASADLMVVGTRGIGGFKGLLLGSTSHQVARHADCPVVVVPDSSRS